MIRFSEIDERVRTSPGVYEIRTLDGIALKIGIGSNLRRRLRSHRASRQSGLRTSVGDLRHIVEPDEITSKASILAKHLFFDAEIAPDYDLRSEHGRCRFLEERCRITIEYCASRQAAAQIERERERSTTFRYCRYVIARPAPLPDPRTSR